MALRDTAGLQAQHAHRDHVGAMQGHEAVRRTDEVHAGPAVVELVLHDLRDGQPGDRLFDSVLQPIMERHAFGERLQKDGVGFAVALDEKPVWAVDCIRPLVSEPRATFLGQALSHCVSGISVAVQGHRTWHQLGNHLLVWRDADHVRDVRGQSTRGSK
jgi:hypothetical protein